MADSMMPPAPLRVPGVDSSTDTSISRNIARIAVPVGLEMVFQLGLGFIDQIIVGALGTAALAAVGLSNQAVSIASIILAAFGTGTAIQVAQNTGQPAIIRRTTITALGLALSIASVIAVALAFWAQPLLSWFGADAQIVQIGQTYFAVMALTLPLSAANAVVGAALRATGRARTVMLTTMLAVVVNTVLGYGLVFGFGPLAALGVAGAAWATWAAQAIKATLLIRCLLSQPVNPASESISLSADGIPVRKIAQALVQRTWPLAAKEIFWSAGTFIYTLLFVNLGTQALAAGQIIAVIEAMFIVASLGLMSAATILMGEATGAGDSVRGQANIRALLRAGTITGLVFGALCLGAALILNVFFPGVESDVIRIAGWGLLIGGLVHVVKVRNMIMVGILPACNDSRSVVVGDSVGTFGIGVPLAYVLAFVMGGGVWGIFAARVSEEVLKSIYFQHRIRWLRNQVLLRH